MLKLLQRFFNTLLRLPSSHRQDRSAKKNQWSFQLLQLLRPQSRAKIQNYFVHSFLLITTLGSAALLGILLNTLLKKPTSLSTSSPNSFIAQAAQQQQRDFVEWLKTLEDQDPFRTLKSSVKPLDLTTPCELSEQKSQLPISVLSTVVMQQARKSIAAIRYQQDVMTLRVGDSVEQIARIDGIERLKVILRNLKTGSCEYLNNLSFEPLIGQTPTLMTPQAAQDYLKQLGKKEIVNDGNKFKISKNFLKSQLGDINKILTQAHAVPLTNPDGTSAFRIEEVDAGSIFSQLNINNGDIIQKINNQKIQNSLEEIMNLFQQLQTGQLSGLNLTIERQGQEVKQEYVFTNE